MSLIDQPKEHKKTPFLKAIILIIIISVIFGAAAGGLGGWYFSQQIVGDIMQQDNGDTIIREKTLKIVEDSSLIDVVESAQDEVVSILITKEVSVFDSTGFFDGFIPSDLGARRDEKVKRQIGGGTGFIISEDGLILTNKHVVADEDAEYTVVLNDGTEYEATVIDRDTLNDIAFISIDAKGISPLELGDSDQIQIGQTVVAIGNTLSEYSNTVTKGIISGIDRKVVAGNGQGASSILESAIQTDAAINPGNSGGPLLNLEGQVIGINTAINRAGEGIGFAIPINEAKQLIESIKKEGRIVRPFLGVRYFIINDRIATREELPIDHGALILEGEDGSSAIVQGSPADKAGLKNNDIIYKVNGKEVNVDDGLAELLAQYNVGDDVTLSVRRGDKDFEMTVTLGDRDDYN